jgi:Flp pilus assembly CpaE family ATPase
MSDENKKRGIIIVSASSKGGTGKTTVALCTASMIYHASKLATENNIRHKPLKVGVLELDTRDGQIGFLIGQYAPTALNVYLDPDKSAKAVLNHMVYDERLGISVLLAPKRARTANFLTPEFYSDVLDRMTEEFDVVMVDTSVNYLEPLLGVVALPKADAIMFVTNLSIASVYGMKRWMDEVTSPLAEGGNGLDIKKIGVVINQSAPDLGIDQELLSQAASGAHLLAAIPMDAGAVIAASNHNRLIDIINHHQFISPAYFSIVKQLLPNEPLWAPVKN